MEQDSTVAENGSVLEEFKEANAAKKIINSLPKIVGDQVLVENATELFLLGAIAVSNPRPQLVTDAPYNFLSPVSM
ncbi:hypothetical protein LSH36_6g04010 [Paralvinella palmiformis]|uniref:Uncharacterized protein n=1 Tax=Paralvinella palmiformis TaxID=53620 RepID=A0AAD9KER3_9ANNE|nr:hypothetical protein LSH36_6g04010 [Paralvinella palmiformis]